MKATVFYLFFLHSPCSITVYRHESGRCCSFPSFLTNFLSFHLFRFSFYINNLFYFIFCVYCFILTLSTSWNKTLQLITVHAAITTKACSKEPGFCFHSYPWGGEPGLWWPWPDVTPKLLAITGTCTDRPITSIPHTHVSNYKYHIFTNISYMKLVRK